MEIESLRKELLIALNLYPEYTEKDLELMDRDFDKELELLEQKFDKKIEELNTKMNEEHDSVNQKLDQLGKKVDGIRVELTETQEITDFVLNKIAQHEKKLR